MEVGEPGAIHRPQGHQIPLGAELGVAIGTFGVTVGTRVGVLLDMVVAEGLCTMANNATRTVTTINQITNCKPSSDSGATLTFFFLVNRHQGQDLG